MNSDTRSNILLTLIHISGDGSNTCAAILNETNFISNTVKLCQANEKKLRCICDIDDDEVVDKIGIITCVFCLLHNIIDYAGNLLSQKEMQAILELVGDVLSMVVNNVNVSSYDNINDNSIVDDYGSYNFLIQRCIRVAMICMQTNENSKSKCQFEWRIKILIDKQFFAQLVSYFNKIMVIISEAIDPLTLNNFEVTCEDIAEIFGYLLVTEPNYSQYIIDIGFLQEIEAVLIHINQNQQFHLNLIKIIGDNNSRKLVEHMLGLIGLITAGTIEQTQILIDNGILKLLIRYLKIRGVSVETIDAALWALSMQQRECKHNKYRYKKRDIYKLNIW